MGARDPRHVWHGLLAILLLLASMASLPAQAEPLSVRGRVVAEERGDAVTGARVLLFERRTPIERGEDLLAGRLQPPPVAEGASDGDGFFDLEAPEAGMYVLEVQGEDVFPLAHRLTPLLADHVAPAAEIAGSGRFEVVVRAAGGRPIEGALVRVSPSREGRFAVADGWTPGNALGRTDAQGQVADGAGRRGLPGAPGARLDVQVVAPGFVPVSKEAVDGRRLEVELAPGRPRALHVRSAGRAAAGALVLEAKSWLPLGRTDAAGALSIAVGGDDLRVLVLTTDGASKTVAIPHLPPDTEAAPPIEVDLSPPTVVTGRVIDRESRRPVAGALVWIDPSRWTRADGAGAYRAQAGEVPRLAVSAAAAGYLEDRRSVPRAEGDGPVDGPTLALEPALLVSGVVRDRQGDPIEGVSIEAEPKRDLGGGMVVRTRSAWSSRGNAVTDAGGRYSLPALSPEIPHEVELRRTGYAPTQETLAPAEPGSRVRLDVTLEAGRSVFGFVVDRRDEPIANAEMRFVREEEDPTQRLVRFGGDEAEPDALVSSDSEGKFETADLASSRYRVEASAPGFAPTTVPGVRIEATDGPTDLGTIILAPGVAVEGRVVDDTGTALPGVDVWAQPGGGMGFGMFRPDRAADAVSAEDGFFSLPDLREGETVNVIADKSGYARGTVAGVVAPPPEPLVVELETASSVAGRVVDPDRDPVADAMVSIQVERQGGGFAMFMMGNQARSDDEGHFEVEDVQAGPIKIVVRAAGYRTAEIGGHEVVRGRDLEGLELVVEPGADVAGTVTDAQGVPVIAASVSVVVEGESEPMARYLRGAARTETDGDGRYHLEGVEPGRRSVEAEHGDHGRAVRELDVKPGTNRLDLRFDAAFEVSGVVVDQGNQPVGGAQVSLSRGTGSWNADHRAASQSDGSFRFQGVPPGRYSLTAEADGHARTTAPDPVVIEGAPIHGLEVRLAGGASLVGNLLGLTFDELKDVQVFAFSQTGGMRTGDVDFEGAYEISGLAPGDWGIRAQVPGSGRSVEEMLKVEPGDVELVRDLEFGTGLALTGVVRHEGQPLDGAMVALQGESVGVWKNATTDYQGRFRLEGLEPGQYQLLVLDLKSGLQHREPLALENDRDVEIDVRTVLVEGRILSAADRSPVPGASLSFHPLEADTGDPFRSLVLRGTSDDAGGFRVPRVPMGRWTVQIEKAGYSRREEAVDTTGGFPPEPLEVLLEPTEGLTLRVTGAAGSPPDRVMLGARDAAGRVILSGTFPTGEGGTVRLATLPPGSYELLVAADGLAVAGVRATAPLESPTVVLVPEARLVLELPDKRDDSSMVSFVLRDPRGSLLEIPAWGGTLRSRHEFSHGTARIGSIPPGIWTLEVSLPSGETRTETVTLGAGDNRVEM